MERLSFASESLSETEAFLSSAYTPMRIGGRPERTGTRIERRAAEGLVVDELAFDYTMAYDAGRLERICLLTIHEGTVVDTTGGKEEIHGPGETFLIAQPDRPYTGEVRSASYTITMFDPDVLTRVAGGPGPVRLTGQRAHGPDGDRLLARTVAYLRDDVMPATAAEQPLVVASAVRLLAAAALASFPHTGLDGDPARTDGRGATSDTLRRAIDFIEANAHRDIGLAEIAASIPVTPRAVQYAFKRHARTTPLAHLRQVRLARAHAELKTADPTTASVTAIAAKWGFGNFGRFAGAHRAAYGVSPGALLRGRR
ncbi:helix-turn-helix transcriptional regulator [Streptomyces sp. NPDC001373]|uniref:helix-turn-helix transcriptional regulator n=1 Tax=Streptomyces sp. NPDC001373 TaxID=3364565 RepID=UPI0036C35E16